MSKPRYEDVHRVCAMCGREITGPFGTYRFGISSGMICYDCDAKVAEENRRRRQAINAETKRQQRAVAKSIARDPMTKQIRYLYNKGFKPTQIAANLGIETEQVYKRLEE